MACFQCSILDLFCIEKRAVWSVVNEFISKESIDIEKVGTSREKKKSVALDKACAIFHPVNSGKHEKKKIKLLYYAEPVLDSFRANRGFI